MLNVDNDEMDSMWYLYKKTHETGLKYLGITKQDPYTYRGSGTRWNNLLRKHGNKVDTEILYETTDKEKLKQKGIHFSLLWDIVKSPEWANLKIEEGDGGFDHITQEQRDIANAKMRETKLKNPSIPWNKGKRFDVYLFCLECLDQFTVYKKDRHRKYCSVQCSRSARRTK